MKRCTNCGRLVDDDAKECNICHSTTFEKEMDIDKNNIVMKPSNTKGSSSKSLTVRRDAMILGFVIGIDEIISFFLCIKGIQYWNDAKYYLNEGEGYFDSQLSATLALILFVLVVGMEITLFLFLIAFNQKQKIKLDLLKMQSKEK